MQKEEWRDVKGYEGIYQISTCGRVKRIRPTQGTQTGRILKDCDNGNGYRYIKLSNKTVTRNHYVHVLMAQAFLPNPENKPQVNHINGIKSANWIANLEWATLSENMLHASETGLTAIKGEQNPMSRYTSADVLEIRRLYAEGHSQRSIGKRFGMSFPNVHRIVRRQLWQHL